MSKTTLDKRMRSMELFHSLRVPPDNWLVLRIDGRSFSRFTAVETTRRRLKVNRELPFKDEYALWLQRLLG